MESEFVEIHEFEYSYANFAFSNVRPSSIFPKSKDTSLKDNSIRAERVALYKQRLDNNQDIWTGNPLPFDVNKLK
jgi:hypothetical protein